VKTAIAASRTAIKSTASRMVRWEELLLFGGWIRRTPLKH